MAVLMNHVAPNGASGNYFRINRIEGLCSPREPVPRWEIWVGFYASQDVRAEHMDPIFTYRVNVPFKDLQADPRTGEMPNFYSVIKDYAPFAGQAVLDIVDDSDNLELDVAKAMKKDEINRAWLVANNSHFTYLGKDIATDEVGHQNIMSTNGQILLCGTFPKGWPGHWKTMDPYPNETYIPITTIDEWKDFFQAMTDQGAANYARAQALKQLVNSAADTSQVNAIYWGLDLTAVSQPDLAAAPA